jgi:betaine-aldehyde dehydrogenase
MIATLFKARRLGPPFQAGTEMGPLISSVHREKVMRHVVSGIAQGAHLVCGGQPPPGETFHRGFYWEPTLFAEVTSEMSIFQDEIFGPVLSVCPFDCEDEAIDLANKTIYGLSGSVWTADQDRAMRVARAVDSGVLSINSLASIHLEAPFGGFKFSGIGRELGLAALDTYSESKTVFIADLGS